MRPAIKALLLWMLCAMDLALGGFSAWEVIAGVRAAGWGRIGALDNAAHLLLTAFLLGVPILVWRLGGRVSDLNRLLLAALPIVLFFALGGKLWVRVG